MTLVQIGTRSRILPPEGPFRFSFLRHISARDQGVFTRFGGYVDIELLRCVEWSEFGSFGNLIWRTAAM